MKLILCFSLFILLWSCYPSKTGGFELFDYNDFKSYDLVSVDTLPIKIDIHPSHLFIKDSLLILSNTNNDKWISVYNISTGMKLCDAINRGRANNELITRPHRVLYDNKRDEYVIFSQNRLIRFDIKPQKDSCIIEMKDPFVQFNVFPEKLASIGEKGFVSTHHSIADNRLCFYNITGDTIKNTASYPKTKDMNFSDDGNLWAFVSYIISNYDKNRIVVTNKISDIIEIYDLEGNKEKLLLGPNGYLPMVHDMSNDQVKFYTYPEDARQTYFKPLAKKETFWVEYRGINLYNQDVQNNTTLMSFNWSGNPQLICNLSCVAEDFYVDDVEKIIYALVYEEEDNIIVKFKYN